MNEYARYLSTRQIVMFFLFRFNYRALYQDMHDLSALSEQNGLKGPFLMLVS